MNLLIIFADQQHKYALGRRNPLYQTPHLDALADDGVLFRNAYSPNPVCGPYRGCLMTGLPTCRNGLYANDMPLTPGIPTLAQRLNVRGWQTGFVGKWHLGGHGAEPIPVHKRGGFQRFKAYQMYNGFDVEAPYHNRVAFYDENDVETIYREHRTKVTTNLAAEMLETMAQKPDPFCMVVAYQAPHYPEQPSPEFEALYKDTVFPVPEEENIEPYTQTYNPPSAENWADCPDYRRYGGSMAEYRRLYAAMVSQVDAGVGQLVETLRRMGKYEDTLIVYTADHGDMQGSHGLKNKCLPYEMSAGVPMIIRCPGGRRGESDALISGLDIMATACELAGDDYRAGGQSFLAYMKGETDAPFNGCVVSETLHGNDRWRLIRTPQYKLVARYPGHEPLMLFDMIADEKEEHNLLSQADPEWVKGLIRQMEQKLNA